MDNYYPTKHCHSSLLQVLLLLQPLQFCHLAQRISISNQLNAEETDKEPWSALQTVFIWGAVSGVFYALILNSLGVV